MNQTKPKRYSTEQMREYMRARYAKNKELGANISQLNYYKRKGILTKEDTEKYGEYAAYIVKAKKARFLVCNEMSNLFCSHSLTK